MDNNNRDDVSLVQTKEAPNQLLSVDKTAILEYLDIVKSEYEIERNKKLSFENRAGLIMALLSAICIFLFEKVNLKCVFSLMFQPLTFLVLVRIICGFAVYICFIYTMVMIIRTIIVKQHSNFEVKSIDEDLLVEQRILALCRIIFTYRDIIVQHREINEKRANTFRKSLYGIFATFITIIVYIILV